MRIRQAARFVASLTIAVVTFVACADDPADSADDAAEEGGDMSAKLTITSPGFDADATIPVEFTCDGNNASPPLAIDGVPSEAVELALLLEDPDAPGGTFVHWVMWGIDPATTAIGPGQVPAGAVQGSTSFGAATYGGPCPPPGDDAHRYIFTAFALSAPLDLAPTSSADDVRAAIDDVIIAKGSLTGTYGR